MIYLPMWILLSTAVLGGLFQLLRAKDASGKAVALDVLTTLTTGILLVLSFVLQSSFLLDIAVIYAVLSFAALIVVARYLEGGL